MDKLPLVLIIEDSPTQAQRIAAALTSRHVQTVIAADGVEGLCAASEQQPDLIVLDVNLPSMDGYQVCRRLKRDRNTRNVPVVMLTTSDSAEATVLGLEAGADDYISKDVWATENLLTTLSTYLHLNEH